MTLPFDPRMMATPRRRGTGVAALLGQAAAGAAPNAAASPGYTSTGQLLGAVDQRIGSDLGYNAQDALNRYAQGAWGSVQQGLQQTLADTRGRSVGAGRFDSGYLDEDQGMVIRQTADDFGNRLAQQSMNAEQLTQDVQGRGEDALWGRTEQAMNDERDAAERKRRKKSGIFGAIGTALGGAGGFLLGGPAGAAAGAKIGGSIGGAF